MKSIFSQNLIKARKLKGWSQEGAAATIGIKRRLLGKYEEDEMKPSYHVIGRICKTYQVINLHAFQTREDYFEAVHHQGQLLTNYETSEGHIQQAVNLLLKVGRAV